MFLLFIFKPDIARGETNCGVHISGSVTTVQCQPDSFKSHFQDFTVEQQISYIESLRKHIHELELSNEIAKRQIGLSGRISLFFSGVTNDAQKKKIQEDMLNREPCIEKCKGNLSHLERSLRKKGKEILKEIKENEKQLNKNVVETKKKK